MPGLARWARNVGATVGVTCAAAAAAGCGSAQLERPTSGPCVAADLVREAARARTSLVVKRWRPGPFYDAGHGASHVSWTARRSWGADAEAVISFPDPDRFAGAPDGFSRLVTRSWVYDAALVVLWRVRTGDVAAAARLLDTLAALQREDGAWGFSFAVENDGFYNAAYVRTGAVAWVVYAFAKYQRYSGDRRFAEVLAAGVGWLLGQIDPRTGLVRAGSGRWLGPDRFDPDAVADFTATEHVLDAWFALRAAALADPELNRRYALDGAADRLAAAAEARLWLPATRRYAQGAGATHTDTRSALDAAGTWAALYALAHGQPLRARGVLDWVAAEHAIAVAGWRGLRPYARAAPDTWFVEGSLAVAMVLARLGALAEARATLHPFAQLACSGGVPLVYSPIWREDFPLSPAAAPTVWFLFAADEVAHGHPGWLWNERPAAGAAPRATLRGCRLGWPDLPWEP
ncbi:MAG: hypothetical protein EXR79_03630 [Myxococcales bacterium]|nr:hypothetical protein [Myxococcales bacterium]